MCILRTMSHSWQIIIREVRLLWTLTKIFNFLLRSIKSVLKMCSSVGDFCDRGNLLICPESLQLLLLLVIIITIIDSKKHLTQ